MSSSDNQSNSTSDPAELLQTLIIKRGHIKGRLTRFKNFVDTFESGNRTVTQIKTRLELFDGAFKEFDMIQSEIEMLDNSIEQNEQREVFEDEFIEVVARAKDVIESSMRVSSESHSHSNRTGVGIEPRLPDIPLTTFSGDYREWPGFIDNFCSLVHNNSRLSNSRKLYYLKTSLKGEAADVITSYKINDENYDTAFDLLKKTYSNPKLIKKAHVASLFNIPCVKEESLQMLRKFLNEINKHLKALENLGENTSDPCVALFLVHLFSSKLDKASEKEWEIKYAKCAETNLQHFIDFLAERCNILQNIESSREISNSLHDLQITDKSNKRISKPFSKKSSTHSFVTASSSSSSQPLNCYFCKGTHSVYNCRNLLKVPIKLRLEEIKKLKLCTNCLRPGHFTSACESSTCRYCHKKHNSLLHQEEAGATGNISQSNDTSFLTEIAENSGSEPSQVNVPTPYSLHSSAIKLPHVLLSTAIIEIVDYSGKNIKARALLDNGSQSNFITAKMFNRLRLMGNKVSIPITGIGRTSTNINYKTEAIIKSQYNKYSHKMSFLIIDKITEKIPYIAFNKSNLNIPENIKLADPHFNQPNEIDLLIGAGFFWDLLCVGQINNGRDMPVLQKTKLGWIVSGTVPVVDQVSKAVCNFSTDIGSQLEKFWEIEHYNQKVHFSAEELECERVFFETTKRDINGRFIVNLPMRLNDVHFGNSRELAKKRFNYLEKRFKNDLMLKQKYVEFMEEYNYLGHMSEVVNTDTKNVICYLPHHGVFKESSLTTKLRVVFDASMTTDKNISLNKILLSGPTIQNDLFSIVTRFRTHQCVIIADVAKMYRQILITEKQRDLQRIFWRSSESEPLREYRLNTLTYGTSPASFIATRCLKALADEFEDKFPHASNVIRNDFYMDDLMSGAESVERAIILRNEIITILESGGFQLRKWMANNIDILSDSQRDNKISQYIITDDSKTKTLGLLWNAKSDEMQVTCNARINKMITKRTILSSISQIFDPLGLVGPITVKGKIIMQQIWQLRLEWDESVPQNIYTEWDQLRRQLHLLNQISVPRCVCIPNAANIQLHGFSDASLSAYGACLYMRSVSRLGGTMCHLICAKSRVAPIKSVTLPRLELCAALLLAELTSKVVKSLKMNIDHITYWCDSEIVLAWIAAEANQWKLFVANRVAEIQRLTEAKNWRHVSSADNPADTVSRGCTPEELLGHSIWWVGPEWLQKPSGDWPQSSKTLNRNPTETPEYKNPKQITCLSLAQSDIFSRYSSFAKLRRIVAYCLRFKNNSLHNDAKIIGPLTVPELQASLNVLITLCQSEEFGNEIKFLASSKTVPSTNRLASLHPFLDSENIIRVGGRINKADINYYQKHPIILPSSHPFTRLIIQNEHIRNFHSGQQLTLSQVRLRYWPLKGRSTVRKIIRNCVTCFKINPRTYFPQMASLPYRRVKVERPFFNCGIDYAGPFFVKDGKTRNRKIVKCYLCIFVCFSTKAVHLELAGDLSTESFLNSLKRFIARRGICKNIHCDNGTNFIGAKNELTELCQFLKTVYSEPEINQFLTENQISWHFIPPRSPHMGGLWEAAVRSAKYHAKRIVGNSNLTYEGLSTIFAQIESILNSRPLTPMSNDPQDLNPLTPSHFLIGDVATAIPEVSVETIPENRLTLYHRLQQMTQHFWKRWKSEYLSTLQQRSKWRSQPNNKQPQQGDMVIIKMDNAPPLHWPIGRVTELHPGDDGIVRVVSVRTTSGVTKRSVSKLCLLPIDSEN